MSSFPHRVDLNKSPHLLFEIGSIMLTLFGALLLVTLLLLPVGYVVEVWLPHVLVATIIFGLLTANGLGILVLSTAYE